MLTFHTFWYFSLFIWIIISGVATRFNIGVMMFTACMVCYMLRVNISINIVDMVQHIPKNDTKLAFLSIIVTNIIKTYNIFINIIILGSLPRHHLVFDMILFLWTQHWKSNWMEKMWMYTKLMSQLHTL